MATFVKGDAVPNATSYELFENVDGTYTSLATASEINFEVSAMGLAEGLHYLVVKAKAEGYSDSDYSNEVVYAEGEWLDLPVTQYALGVTSTGTGRVSANNAKRFSTADDTTPNAILIPAGKTMHLKGLASGEYPLRVDYVYIENNVVCPPAGSTTAIEGLVGTASNYVASDYFPLNTDGNDALSITNDYGNDYYFYFGFAGQTLNEGILAAFDSYDIKYYIE